MKTEQFEAELTRHLGPVEAPGQLWGRIRGAREQDGKQHRSWGVRHWAAVSLATLALAAGIRVGVNRALSRATAQVEFRSGDPAELRAWIKTGTGMDVPLPDRIAPSVHLMGASHTSKTAEISYRVGSLDTALVVSNAKAEDDGRHTLLSWTMRGQIYTIAAADARLGCILCHST